MRRFSKGDRVRIDIPDESDPEHNEYHGVHGRIVNVFRDDAASVTGQSQDSELYRVALETGEEVDFRGRDVRIPIDE